MQGLKDTGTGQKKSEEAQRSRFRIAMAVLSGILLVVIQPPVSLYPIAYISLVPLFHSLKRSDIRHNFIMGFFAGITAHLGQIYWIVIAMNRYGGLDIYTSITVMLLLVLYLAVYVGMFTASSFFLNDKLSVPFFVSAPFIWVLLEYVRGVLFTGFPWSFLAHSQHGFLTLIQAASITGTYFLSFLIVAANCILYGLFTVFCRRRTNGHKHKAGFIVYTIIIIAFFVASCVYGHMRLKTPYEGNLKAVIVQGNIKQDVKWDESFKIGTMNKYLMKTSESGRGADIVVWPETAMPFVFDDEKHINVFIREAPVVLQTSLLFGTVSRDRLGKYRNSAYFIDSNGSQAGVYSKVHLVPFGEYTPLVAYLPFLLKFTAAGGDFAPGESHSPIDTPLGKIGMLICYEGTFPKITVETVKKGAEVLVNLTNDAWYDRTSAPYQHLVFYIFRAIEADRYVLRAANTGISTIIDPRGRIRQQTGLFEEDIISGTFSLKNDKTPYVIYGDYFILLSFVCLLLACLTKMSGTLRRKRVNSAQPFAEKRLGC